MLDQKHKELLESYEREGMIPRVIQIEKHLSDSGKEEPILLFGNMYGLEHHMICRIVPHKPASRWTVNRWRKLDKSGAK